MDEVQSISASRQSSDRWYQWSLLELVLVTVIVAECLSLWRTDKHYDAEDLANQAFWESVAARRIASHDGSVYGEPQVEAVDFARASQPSEPDWLWPELSRLLHLKLLDLTGLPLDDRDMRQLGRALPPSIECLDVSYSGISDEGLKELSRLKNLTRIFVDGTKVTSKGEADFQKQMPKKIVFHRFSPTGNANGGATPITAEAAGSP